MQHATLYFRPGAMPAPGASEPARSGDPRAGGALVLRYDLDRLGHRDRYWVIHDLRAYVRLHPDGPDLDEPLRGSQGPGRREFVSRVIPVPPGAVRLELWFRAIWHHGTGRGETQWDSRYGQNYWVELAPGAVDAEVY